MTYKPRHAPNVVSRPRDPRLHPQVDVPASHRSKEQQLRDMEEADRIKRIRLPYVSIQHLPESKFK